jgi:hypothetical protein
MAAKVSLSFTITLGPARNNRWYRITIPTSEQEPAAAPSKSGKNKTTQPQITFKWERRKRASDAYAPSLRSGCTMALWNRTSGMGPTGILFGGVTDEDTNEETLESVFHNDT